MSEPGKIEGASSAAEFRELAEFEPEVLVPLPSGAKATLRRPRPLYFMRVRKGLPQSLAARVQGVEPTQPTDEELVATAKFWVRVWTDIFVNPRVAENPGADEIDPQWIQLKDAEFIMRWAVGEVASDGSDLAAFRDRQAGASPVAVRTGTDVPRDAAQPVSA